MLQELAKLPGLGLQTALCLRAQHCNTKRIGKRWAQITETTECSDYVLHTYVKHIAWNMEPLEPGDWDCPRSAALGLQLPSPACAAVLSMRLSRRSCDASIVAPAPRDAQRVLS